MCRSHTSAKKGSAGLLQVGIGVGIELDVAVQAEDVGSLGVEVVWDVVVDLEAVRRGKPALDVAGDAVRAGEAGAERERDSASGDTVLGRLADVGDVGIAVGHRRDAVVASHGVDRNRRSGSVRIGVGTSVVGGSVSVGHGVVERHVAESKFTVSGGVNPLCMAGSHNLVMLQVASSMGSCSRSRDRRSVRDRMWSLS